jgi:hypothetical protein
MEEAPPAVEGKVAVNTLKLGWILWEQLNLGNYGMRLGISNIRSLYRASFLVRISKELSKCKLDLVRVQGVR